MNKTKQHIPIYFHNEALPIGPRIELLELVKIIISTNPVPEAAIKIVQLMQERPKTLAEWQDKDDK